MTPPAVPAWRERPPFRLGTVDVQPASNEIVVEGTLVRLKPRLMDVLLRLAAAPGEVVSREALLADAWPRRMVNDDVLSRAIADLRVALHDEAREPRFIETLPKVGYRLLAPVTDASIPQRSGPAPGSEDVAPAAAHGDAAAGPTSPVAPAAASRGGEPPAPRRFRWPRVLAVAAVGVVALYGLYVAFRREGHPDDVAARLVRQLAHAEPFSSGPELEVGPRFSPDGTRVAFAAGRDRKSQIVIRDVRGGGRTTVGDADSINLSPVFFPDGKRIAFFHATADGNCEIVAHDLASQERTRLVDCAREPRARFDLAPDGMLLVYTGKVRPDFPAGLVLRDLRTGSERVLTTPAPDAGDDAVPRFSPDGTRIAFFRGTQSHRQLWLADVAGTVAARNVNGPRGLAYGAAWLDSAGPLLVAADWFGQRSLNVIDPATGVARPVGARGARFPDADGAGNLVFENAVYSANLFALDVERPGAPPRELWPSMRYTNQAEFAPDGERVTFISNRDGAAAVYVAQEGQEPRRLTATDEFVYMRPHWSHDGRSIYAVRVGRREDGGRRQEAVRLDPASGAIEVLVALGDAVFDLRPAGPDAFIVGEIADNAARITRTNDLRQAPLRLPLPVTTEYQVAGGRVALLQPALDGLTLCDLATLKCEPLALPIGEGNRFDWLLARDAVYYRPPGTHEIVRHDLRTRMPTWRTDFGPTAVGVSIAMPPDGRKILVARESPLAVDLMLAPRHAR